MKEVFPCAVYTRKSSEDGLEQGFNSLDAQREACEAYILSQKAQGWQLVVTSYDDGGFSGGNTERPGLTRLLADIAVRQVKIVVVYKVDRLTRSLADFAKLVELFDAQGVSFVSVTQQFNTTSSMGRLTLNVLLSFAQFEREVTGERIRDKIAASKRKGMWMGGSLPIGYVPNERTLAIDEPEARRVREIYRLYLELGCVRKLKAELERLAWVTPIRKTRRESHTGGRPFGRGHLYRILSNPIYIGRIAHKGAVFPGQHPAIIDVPLWQAVQDQLAANLQGHRTRATAVNPSLLTDLVFDDQGNRLTPTHARKGARRYRYYVGQPLLVSGREAVPGASRWPAQELEGAVVGALARFLMNKSRLVTMMGTRPANEVQQLLNRAAELAEQISSATASKQMEILKRIVARIGVFEDRIEITMRLSSMALGNDLGLSQELIEVISVPVTLKRCGQAVRLIVRVPGKGGTRRADPKLVALLGKAHQWFELLSSGKLKSVEAIAKEVNLSSSYVTRVIYCAFLAPDIVRKIVRGEHPLELNAMRMMQMLPLPIDWAEQRSFLG